MAEEKEKKNQKKGMSALTTLLLTLLIVTGVLFGAAYIVVRNDVKGVSTKYKTQIEKVPVLQMALPGEPDVDNPEDLNYEELLEKYLLMKEARDQLQNQVKDVKQKLDDTEKQNKDLTKTIENTEQLKKETETQKTELDNEKKLLEEEQKKVNEMIANGDKEGLKNYFEKVDSETAKKVYEEVVKKQTDFEEAAKFAQIYETMDPGAAAEIFEKLGTSKLDLTVSILQNMKNNSAAEILAAMDSKFSSKITERMSKFYNLTTP